MSPGNVLHGALVAGHDTGDDLGAETELIDVLGRNVRLGHQLVGTRDDQHDCVAGADDAADGMDGKLMDDSRSAAHGFRAA